jgi:hypothetical protein
MTIPPEVQTSPLAAPAAKVTRLEDTVRAARIELQRLARDLPAAEKADVRAAGAALAAGDTEPPSAVHQFRQALLEAQRTADVATSAYNIAVAEFGAALQTEGMTWRRDLDAGVQADADTVRTITAQLAEATASLQRRRIVRAWLDHAVTTFRRQGRIPSGVLHSTPSVQIGGLTLAIDDYLAAVPQWCHDDAATTDRTWSLSPEPHWSITQRDLEHEAEPA